MFCMCGMDCTAVPLEIRERVALSAIKIKILTEKIMKIQGIEACMLLSTCNRTELYISGEYAGIMEASAFVFGEAESCCIRLEGDAAARHLFETACGLHSMIRRETQIISQLTAAEKTARKLHSLNAQLGVLVRLAVTTAKKAAGIAVEDAGLSSAQLAADWLEREYGDLKGRQILVTGNGNVGRLAAKILSKKGADVTMTLRLHTNSVIPQGCFAIPYDERYKFKADVIVSATKSPHFTYKDEEMQHDPDYLIDLAVPRDIAPSLRERYGSNYRCVDDFVKDAEDHAEILALVDEGIKKFHEWETYKNTLPLIGEIKDMITKRLCAADAYDENEITDLVGRTVDMLLCSMKEDLSEDSLKKSLEKLERRARL